MIWRLWGLRLPVAALVLVLYGYHRSGYLGLTLAVLILGAIAVALRYTGAHVGLIKHERVHRARCHIRATWRTATAGAGLVKLGVEPSINGFIKSVDGGLWFKVTPAPGHDASTWQNAVGPLCKWWGCAELEIRDHLSRRKGQPTQQLEVSCSLAGILLAPVRWPYGAPERVGWTRANLPIGHFSGGRPATLDLEETHLMVGGVPGGGKTVFLHTLLCSLGLLDDEALIIFDLKGVDLEPWRPRSAAFCHDPKEAYSILQWANGLMNGRYFIMQENNRRAAAGEAGFVHQPSWTPHPDGPHVTIIIDEYAELDAGAFALWDRLARVGRAAGFSLVTCTQRPGAELGEWFTRIRTNSIARIAMGALGPTETRMVLDAQNVPKAFVTLPKGTGRLVSGESAGRTFRVYWSEQDVREVAASTVARRPSLTMEQATA